LNGWKKNRKNLIERQETMRKIWLSSLLLVVLVLTACKGNATATPTATPTSAPTEIPGAKPGECQVASSLFPAPRPASAAVYAPITASDYSKGPADATMTIIEYSDYQ
jgi:hypothetical protein